jgi:hypothetical protein
MSDTPHLGLPLLATAQAQKHVTMNDALMRLDALSVPSVISASLSSPSAIAVEGDAYLIGPSPSNVWSGHEGGLAFFVNDGWSFAVPRSGWRLWLLDQGRHTTFVGDRWVDDLSGPFIDGAYGALRMNTHDLELTEASVNSTPTMIPAGSIVHCVSARVIEEITGDLVSWRLGVANSNNRYGNGMGRAKNSTAVGLTGSPLTYYSDEVVQVEPNGGQFTGGRIRVGVHYMNFQPADAV